MTDDERFKKWGEWIMVIYEDVENAIQSRRIHNEIGAILQANPRLWRVQVRLTHPKMLAEEHRVIIALGVMRPHVSATLEAVSAPVG